MKKFFAQNNTQAHFISLERDCREKGVARVVARGPRPSGDSLLASDGGQKFFGFVKRCLVKRCLGYAIWCIIGIFLGLLMRKFDKMSAWLTFSPKYCRILAENAIKPLIFMYHEAMSIFLGSKNVLNSVYFGLSMFSGSKIF